MKIPIEYISLAFGIAGALQWFIPKEKWTTANKGITLLVAIVIALGIQLLNVSISSKMENSITPEIIGETTIESNIPQEESTLTPYTELEPTFTPEPNVELVQPQEYTGKNTKIEYKITLEEDEIIVGQSWGFSCNKETGKNGGCIFLIVGAGDFTFSVTDGEWSRYKNVVTSEQADALLQEKIDYSKETYGYSDDFLKIFRLP